MAKKKKAEEEGWVKNWYESLGNEPKRDPRRPTGDTSRGKKAMGRAVDRIQPSAEEKIRYGSQGLTKSERERMINTQRARASLGGPKPPPSTVKKPKKKR